MIRKPVREYKGQGKYGPRLFDVVVREDNVVYFEVKNGKAIATITYTEVQQQVQKAISQNEENE